MLKKIGPESFDVVYAIMKKSFPDSERRPYNEQKKLLKRKDYSIYVIEDTAGSGIKAFITVYEFKNFLFVEHFAVDSCYRSQGLGSLILKELLRIVNLPVCLEVELPYTEIAAKRIEFYKRCGFVLNLFPYSQPPITQGQTSVPMYIMSSGKALSQNEYTIVKNTLYKQVYDFSPL